MLTLHALQSGEGDNAVFLLHGLFGSASNLNSLARELAQKHRVYRVDLRNHGRSFHLDDMSLSAMADDLIRLMKAESIQSAHIVGHSLGGKVAMQLAMQNPEHVRSLVVADIAPVTYPRYHDPILDAMMNIDLRALKNREQADRALQKAVSEPAIRQFLLKNLTRDRDGRWHWRMNLDAIARNYDALTDAPQGKPYPGPTLFIKGELSDYINEEHRKTIMRLFPSCDVRVIEGAGHWLHAEQPAAFNQLVARFLEEHS